MQQPVIAASILSADFARLGEESAQILAAGADWIHFDVMDNHYVPNLTVGPVVCQALRQYGIQAPIDVHLMVEPVDNLIVPFAKAGATYITFHPEATKHVHRTIQLIKDQGCKPGIVLNLTTPLNVLDYILDDLDMVLLMSINPGFAAQKFIPQTFRKIQQTRAMIDAHGKPIRLEIDGGVCTTNIQQIYQAGIDTFVTGSALFCSENYAQTIAAMRLGFV